MPDPSPENNPNLYTLVCEQKKILAASENETFKLNILTFIVQACINLLNKVKASDPSYIQEMKLKKLQNKQEKNALAVKSSEQNDDKKKEELKKPKKPLEIVVEYCQQHIDKLTHLSAMVNYFFAPLAPSTAPLRSKNDFVEAHIREIFQNQLITLEYPGIKKEDLKHLNIEQLNLDDISFLNNPEIIELCKPDLFQSGLLLFNQKHEVVDKRQDFCDDTILRRMDSLAKLLSPGSHLTSCIAVSFIQNKLIISSNLECKTVPQATLTAISEKMDLLRQYFISLNLDNEEQPIFNKDVTEDTINNLLDDNGQLTLKAVKEILDEKIYNQTEKLIEDLKQKGGLFQPEHVLFQAALKMLTAMRSVESFHKAPKLLNIESLSISLSAEEDSLEASVEALSDDLESSFFIGDKLGSNPDLTSMPIFSEACRQAILEPSTALYLLPHKIKDKDFGFKIYDGLLNEAAVNSFGHEFKPSARVSHIHAEQLIAYYYLQLKKINPELEDKIKIGISKLCCFDCAKQLKTYPNFLVRGSSELIFEGTLSLLNPDIAYRHQVPQSPQRNSRSPTTFASPAFSPYKNKRKIASDSHDSDNPDEKKFKLMIWKYNASMNSISENDENSNDELGILSMGGDLAT